MCVEEGLCADGSFLRHRKTSLLRAAQGAVRIGRAGGTRQFRRHGIPRQKNKRRPKKRSSFLFRIIRIFRRRRVPPKAEALSCIPAARIRRNVRNPLPEIRLTAVLPSAYARLGFGAVGYADIGIARAYGKGRSVRRSKGKGVFRRAL